MQKVIRGILLGALAAFAVSFIHPVKLEKDHHFTVGASTDRKEQINWLTLSEAELSLKEKEKPVLIDLYTDWCGWCKVMDKKTYSHPEVIRYINEHFIPVKLNAETRDDLSWLGRHYSYQSTYRVNSYALFLTRGELSFPTTVILPVKGEAPQAISGYLEPKEMEIILHYFGEGHYGNQSFQQFHQQFSSKWK